MMVSPDLSYALSALLAAGNVGAFFGGKRAGRAQAQSHTNEAQALTIEAQSARIDVLVAEKGDLEGKVAQLLEDQKHMQVQLDLLKELVLRGNSGNPVVVQAGALPVVPGGGRQNPPGNPSSPGIGSI